MLTGRDDDPIGEAVTDLGGQPVEMMVVTSQ
jgi:hypothetical protein